MQHQQPHADLKNFLARYFDLSSAEMAAVVQKFSSRTIKKHGYVLRQGAVCKDLVFVKRGCLRMYYVQDETENQQRALVATGQFFS
jgi:CRP-like cAMP-binding protein